MAEPPDDQSHTAGHGHHPNATINRLYTWVYVPFMVVYLPMMVLLYLPFAIWEKLRHYLGWIVTGYWPLVVAGVSLLLLIVSLILFKKKPQIPLWARRSSCFALGVAIVGGVGIWGWSFWAARSTPELTWTRLGIDVLDDAGPEEMPRYEQLRIIVDGTATPTLLLTSEDIGKLESERQKHLGNSGKLQFNYAVFESSETWKCPRSVHIAKEDLKAFVGVYVIRDGQVPTVRLAEIGTTVNLAEFPALDSDYRLVVLFFPLDPNTAKVILSANFNPNEALRFDWKVEAKPPKSKGH
jgi:hypothetical protein